MEQIYTRIHSNEARSLGIPNAQPAVVITAGMKRLVTLKMPSFGRITDVAVKQKSTEVLVPFVVELFKSKVLFTPDLDIAVATLPADDPELYRILGPLSALAGAAAELEDNDPGYPFRNMDGGYTNNQRFIYILINPTGAGTTTTWDVAVTCAQA